MVDLRYSDNRVERLCTDEKVMRKEVGFEVAKALKKRLAELRAANALEDLRHGVGRWEHLTGDRGRQWSARVSANWRLIVEPITDDGSTTLVVNLEDYQTTAIGERRES
ncbi:type II toxin-antitoxin system RelE/ParE family toxin [Phytoactinopolyspora endophytica]|uniref:type II toxin-antitoxin system RelE/ParE family toxin n=1 Tax=Phytoactinopolyspora endophytica TaxID=1642495 RepID=UPI00101B7403|nr:type II toxin-antitoxin system RelE/ParE family toxin [Phytoactinopolyspora endophytica]